MVTIMLVCSAGMSTSLLVTKMKAAAEKKNIDTDIFAVSASEVDEVLSKKKIDLLLLGPQVKYMRAQFESKLKDKNIPVDSIDMRDYGLMNGEKVLEKALELIDKNK
jgi:PTS system, Lactose/Cellobiose specific IIB subunit.